MRKTQFPRLVIPLAVVLTTLFNLGLNLVVVFVFILAFGVDADVDVAAVPAAAGGADRAHHRGVDDRVVAVPALPRPRRSSGPWRSTALFYATPVLYPLEKRAGGTLRDVIVLNPLAPLFELARKWVIDPTAPGPVALAGGWARLLPAAAIFVATCVVRGVGVQARGAADRRGALTAGWTSRSSSPTTTGRAGCRGCSTSVAAQTVAPAEVLVVDDGSTDGSAQLAAGYDGVRVLRAGGQRRLRARGQRRHRGGRGRGGRARQHRRRARAGLARARGRRAGGERGPRRWRRSWSTSTTRRSSTAPATCCAATASASSAGASSATAARYDAPGEVFSACAGGGALPARGGAGRRGLRRAARDLPRGRRAGAAAAAGGLALPLGAARGRAARRRRARRSSGGPGRAGWSATRCCSSRATSASAGCRSSPTGSSRGRGTRRATGGCASTSPGVRMALPLLRRVPARARRSARPVDEVIPRLPIRGRARRRPPVAARGLALPRHHDALVAERHRQRPLREPEPARRP